MKKIVPNLNSQTNRGSGKTKEEKYEAQQESYQEQQMPKTKKVMKYLKKKST